MRDCRRRRPRAVWLLAALALAACNLGPDYKRPGVEVPDAYLAAAGQGDGSRGNGSRADGAWPDATWWRGFHSAALDGLIEQAHAHNQDIAAAVARVVQADAQVRQAGAALLPSVTATGSYQYQRSGFLPTFGNIGGLGGTTGITAASTGVGGTGVGGTGGIGGVALPFGNGAQYYDFRTYLAQLGVSYEIDFWGKVRAAERGAQASAVYSRFDAATTALTVTTNVANTWFTARAYRDRIAVARHNVADAEATLAAVRGRLEAGTANALDAAQEETQVATQRALVPNLTSQMRQQVIALGILTGQPPEALPPGYIDDPGSLETLAMPEVAPGLPSTLLERRPDVAAAEAQLVAANANVQQARAAFFPQVQLTAAGGLESGALTALFGPGALLAQLGASLTQPVFDGGTLRGQLEQAKGKLGELEADYRKAVLQAFTDVDTALTAYRYATEQETLQRRAVAVAQRAVDIARIQVQAGTADVTALLQAQITLYAADDTLVQVRLVRLQSLLNLYKSLGGGWAAPSGAIEDQFPGLSPGRVPGGVALPVGGNLR